MKSFEIVSIPTEIAELVRRTGRAPKYGFPVHQEIATGRARAVIVCGSFARTKKN
jgi:hypothetical protein